MSSFDVNGGPPYICRAPAGQMMPTVKGPPVDYAALTMTRHLDVLSPAAARSRGVTVIIRCTRCRQEQPR